MTTHHDDHCTGWHLIHDDGRVASVRRCNACNPDGLHAPEAAPWLNIFLVDGVVAFYAPAEPKLCKCGTRCPIPQMVECGSDLCAGR
jgi:hypothetical protein